MAETRVTETRETAPAEHPDLALDTRDKTRFVSPNVDIYETKEALMLLADLPGIKQEDLSVQIEDGVLTIQARASRAAADEPVYREFELAGYYRQFRLNEEIDFDRVEADSRDGVLQLMLPKVEQAKPRQIPVKFD